MSDQADLFSQGENIPSKLPDLNQSGFTADDIEAAAEEHIKYPTPDEAERLAKNFPDLPEIQNYIRSSATTPTYQCTSDCKIWKTHFKKGDKAKLIGEYPDHFNYPTVKLQLEDGSILDGSKKLFSENFIYLHK